MKQTRTAAALILILLGAMASDSVLARGGHRGGGWHGGGARFGFGVFVGAPLFSYYASPYYSPYYYPPTYGYAPSYYYPPAVAAPAYAPTYPAQAPAQAAPAQPQANWWYYCAASKGYYPYVRECPGGWSRVSPQPPAG